jgi:Zn-dependent M28 family amino/carboxypeptidase
LYDPGLEHLYSFQHRVKDMTSPDLSWLDPQGRPNDNQPTLLAIAMLSVEGSRKFFAASGHSPDDIFAAAKVGKLAAFSTPVTFKIQVVTKSQDVRSPNVVAKLAGSDPSLRGEYVVFTAHLDHMGIGEPVHGDNIYHGALDNASGSAALLEIARAMTGLNPRPRRSILFVSVTGEEEGLLGSDYFAHYPTVPKATLVGDVNIDEDMMLWPLEDVVAYGAEHTSMGAVVNEAAARLHLTVSPDSHPEQVVFIRSDQYAFVKQGIPAILTDAGIKSDNPAIQPREIQEHWEETIYHSPQDSMSQPGLDFAAGVKFAQFNFLCGYLVAQQTARPVWNPKDFFGEHYARK